MSETYAPVQSTFASCAQRVDSLRTECTKSYTTLTVWPGPCECSYYAQDLVCFDEQELCALQVWSQVPQWFRDGVSSCLAKDANYMVRAELGTFEDPFTVSGLAGSLASTTVDSGEATPVASPGSSATVNASATSSSTGGPEQEQSKLTGGSIADIVLGVLAFLGLIAAGILLHRRRTLRGEEAVDHANLHELHAEPNLHCLDDTAVHEKADGAVYELPQHEPVELLTEEPMLELNGEDAKK
ncbi:hypothetical protein Slin14017_G022320 [Septoria linicola]|nr:hypothetical protein Slin14017_G022320 [Septoria linicola]